MRWMSRPPVFFEPNPLISGARSKGTQHQSILSSAFRLDCRRNMCNVLPRQVAISLLLHTFLLCLFTNYTYLYRRSLYPQFIFFMISLHFFTLSLVYEPKGRCALCLYAVYGASRNLSGALHQLIFLTSD